MPSLFRFLFFLALLAGLAYGAMFALVLYVEPNEREVSIRVPRDKLSIERIEPGPVSQNAQESDADSAQSLDPDQE